MNRKRRHSPPGLSRRAIRFVAVHGVWLDVPPVVEWRSAWQAAGIPPAEAQRAADYQARWGGLVLPPSANYDGGPGVMGVDTPELEKDPPQPGWYFEAGVQRTAVPYAFLIGPGGHFGVAFDKWVALHATIEGWVESLALAYSAATLASRVGKLSGDSVADLDLDGMEPVPETVGLADTWWRGNDSLVAIFTGEAELFDRPSYRTAYVYEFEEGDMRWL